MQEILIRAGCFAGIILLGYMLRRIGVFQEGDFKVLSRIVIKITLPASIVNSFHGKEIDLSMLLLALVALGGGVTYMILAWLVNRRAGREQLAFEILNTSGYNIGNFALPFVQGFVGPVGVIATSLFDTGNAFICLGGAYSVAAVIQRGGRFSLKAIAGKLVRSVAFDCYLIMMIICLAQVPVPSGIYSFAEIIADANAFMAMFMIGVGFQLPGNRRQVGSIVRILAVRYSAALVLGVGCYFLLPFSAEVRRTVLLLMFSPIASAAPAFTADLDGDVGLASAVNSVSILCSIVFMVAILLITMP